MNESYLSLGSNIGDRLHMLKQATELLKQHPEVNVIGISSIYETTPVGMVDQAPFLNMAVHIMTSCSALELLDVCQEIEQKLHRKRLVRWGPRTIDLDILLYNQDNMESERLTIPHPRMYERAFVLIPLMELNPSIKESVQIDSAGIELWKTYSDIDSFLSEQ